MNFPVLIFFFKGFSGTQIDKSWDIYTSDITLYADTSHWEILVMDVCVSCRKASGRLIGCINGPQRFFNRLVAEIENGEKAKLTAPGFEIFQGGKVVMSVQ